MTTSTSTGGSARLGQLLSETMQYSKAHWQTLLLGAVVFGALMAVVQFSFGLQTAATVGRGMDMMGIDTERMQELTQRMEAGDEAAMDELADMLDGKKAMAGAAGMAMMKSFAPAMGLMAIVSYLLSCLAYAYFALVAVEGKDVNGTMQRMSSVFLPLTGVCIWSFLRTFAWIPFIGIIPAIILAPRFIAAPLIFLTEGKGITASVSDSYRRTQGYWGKIMGNLIVVVIVIGVVMAIVGALLAGVLSGVPLASVIVRGVIGQFVMAMLTVFGIRLAHTILQHPKA